MQANLQLNARSLSRSNLNPIKPCTPKSATRTVEQLKQLISKSDLRAESPEWIRLMQEGVLVRLHILRWRAQAKINLQDLGLPEPKDNAEREIYDDLMNLGTKKLLPPDIIRKLNALDSGARKTLEKYSFKTYWGNFVPVGAYQEWKEQNEKFCGEYLALGDQIVRDWNVTMKWIVQAYETAARQGYRRLLRLNPKSLTTKDGKRMSENQFVEIFTTRIRQAIPDPQQVKDSFGYETELSYIPLPSLLAEDMAKKEQIETANELERERARIERQAISEREQMLERMNADVVRETRQRKTELANQFIRDVQAQSLGIIYDGFVTVLESIQRNDSLVGKSAEQIRNVIETWRAMNVVSEPTVEAQINSVAALMDKPAAERTTGEIKNILQDIAAAARANMITLGTTPRSARNVGIPDKFEAIDTMRRNRRDVQLKLDED